MIIIVLAVYLFLALYPSAVLLMHGMLAVAALGAILAPWASKQYERTAILSGNTGKHLRLTGAIASTFFIIPWFYLMARVRNNSKRMGKGVFNPLWIYLLWMAGPFTFLLLSFLLVQDLESGEEGWQRAVPDIWLTFHDIALVGCFLHLIIAICMTCWRGRLRRIQTDTGLTSLYPSYGYFVLPYASLFLWVLVSVFLFTATPTPGWEFFFYILGVIPEFAEGIGL